MLRLMTYNVHRCVGVDRRLDVDRIASVIDAARPDIVCLQELDVDRARTGRVDQAQAIADRLSMSVRFNAAFRIEAEQYGDAILTHLPERLVKAGPLPNHPTLPGLEPRGALWSEMSVNGRRLNVINTHLGLVPREQRLQAEALCGPEWLGACEGPTILTGDFNCTSITRPYRILVRRLHDAQRLLALKPTLKTFPAGRPIIRIDHAFVTPDVRVVGASVPGDDVVRVASDHRPLVVDFSLD